MKHYSEADLLETFYTQPGESMPVMMHVADCEECAARYERLERKIRGLAACEHDKPETFWARQRISVMRKIDAQGRRTSTFARMARLATAAALTLVLTGVAVVKNDVATAPEAVPRAHISPLDADSYDPWQSEELKGYQSMVAWESWVDSDTKNGDQSL